MVKNVNMRLQRDGFEFNINLFDHNYSPQNPFSVVEYIPELDTTSECNEDQISFFQNQWIVELDRIDIIYKLSSLSHSFVNPRTSHLF